MSAPPASTSRFRRLAFLDLATVDHGDLDLEPIRATTTEFEAYPTTTGKQVAGRLTGADAVVLNKVRLEAEVLANAQVRIVCLAATGADNIDLDAARSKSIAVANIRNYCTDSVVQHVFALILALTTHLTEYRARLRAGVWARSQTFTLLDLPVRELTGKTLTVVGHGTLGKAVARRAKNFGMRVIVAEHRGAPLRAGRVAFEEALAVADILSLHAPLTEATQSLIDAQSLALMQPDAILINTARGALVDENALAEALRKGRLGGAGLDVLSQEPPGFGHPLLDPELPNCLVTPHIAWAAREARQRAVKEVGANLAAFLAGEKRNRLV